MNEFMLRQKFSYADYERFLKLRECAQAQEYCACFPKDQNAVICGWYAQYFLLQAKSDGNASFVDLDATIRSIHWSIVSRKHQGYDENALYLLGILLFERGFETEGNDILTSITASNKKRDHLSEPEKNARLYLELHYFQKWENGHQLKELEEAANCLGHSEICYLYADMLREDGGDQKAADQYEYIYAVDYCAVWMDRATYNRKHIENHLDQVRDDIRKDIGFIASEIAAVKENLGGIESHLEIISQKIDDLPKAVCDTMQWKFEAFHTQISELSEQMEDREEAVRTLIEKAHAFDLDSRDSRDTMLELKALAEQIRVDDQDREKRLAQSIDDLKSTVLDNLPLKGIVDEAVAEIDNRFHNRLSKDTKESIVTALFTLNFYKKLSKEQESLIEYSGVVILAAAALEIELCNRLYDHFRNYVTARYGQESLKAWYRQPFTLGSFGFIVGIELGRAECNQDKQEEDRAQREIRFREFLRDPSYSGLFSTDPGSLFQDEPENKSQRRLLKNFSGRLKYLRKIRNKAAHIYPVTLEEAEQVCQWSFLSCQERTSKATEESISLLEALLNSCI